VCDVALVTLRFYGRFLFAIEHTQQRKTGIVKAIAPVFDHATFGAHQPLMAIRRDRLAFAAGAVTLRPSSKAVTDAAKIAEAELFLWDLSGLNVSFDVNRQDATLDETCGELISLEFLERLRFKDAVLSNQAIVGDGHGLANAVITLSSGVGTATPVPTQQEPGAAPTALEFNFVRSKDAQAGYGNNPIKADPGVVVRKTLTDLVEFVVDIGTAESLRLIFTSATGHQVGVVTVKRDALVAFSHLCASLPPKERLFDLEFAQYYNLLMPTDRARAVSDDQAVPKPILGSSRSSEGADCDVQAQLDYEA
jgi:hypothetical protein